MPQGYPHGHDERTLVTEAGMASAAGVAASRASGGRVEGWLAGDHHIHTQFSSDGLYRVIDHVQHAHAYGLDWMVITDHASATHAKIGVEAVNPHIRAARSEFDMLVFQGLEWNIPAAEHGTVFVHPGVNEVAVLKQFENEYDGILRRAEGSSPANERLALEGLAFLASAKSSKRVQDALMLANHPARKGIDSPHELRDWRDAPGRIAVGMEGAPGHQAAGIPAPHGPGHPRGEYGNGPTADSFAPYPLESYRTFGGFDWMTATVGGLWDSMLAEGRPWWVTANSDSHAVHLDGAMLPAGGHFHSEGRHADPIYGPGRAERGDFWPGYFSRTMVGARRRDYASVMQALREGRVWVDHGRLVGNLDVTVEAGGAHAGLGGVVMAERGSRVTLQVTVTKAHLPNWAEILPNLATVDAISGPVTGPASDRDSFSAAHTRVVRSWDLSRSPAGEALALRLDLGRVDDRGLYVRLRGSDGNRLAAGPGGAKVDPAGPIIDAIGDADWTVLTGAPALRALTAAGYEHLQQLHGVPMRAVLDLHGMGPKGIRALRDAMAEHGWAFADDDLAVGAVQGGRVSLTEGLQPERNQNATGPTAVDPADWVESLPKPRQREQGRAMLELFGEVTGVPAVMWGASIVGYGELHYVYESGREGDMPRVAFSPRSA